MGLINNNPEEIEMEIEDEGVFDLRYLIKTN
jgi:hypothetical protein